MATLRVPAMNFCPEIRKDVGFITAENRKRLLLVGAAGMFLLLLLLCLLLPPSAPAPPAPRPLLLLPSSSPPEGVRPEDRELLRDIVQTSYVRTQAVALPHATDDEEEQEIKPYTKQKEVILQNSVFLAENEQQKAERRKREIEYVDLTSGQKRPNGTEEGRQPYNITKEDDTALKATSSFNTSVNSSQQIQVDPHNQTRVVQSFWRSRGDAEAVRRTQAELMRQHMDLGADPCEDFYQYACGNWEPLNPIPKDKAGYDTFELLRENLDLVLRDILSADFKLNEDSQTVGENNFEIDNNILRNEIAQQKKTETNSEYDEPSTVDIISTRFVQDENERNRQVAHNSDVSGIEKSKRHVGEASLSLIGSGDLPDDDLLWQAGSGHLNQHVLNADNHLKDSVSATTKAMHLFKSCMDHDVLQQRGSLPLLELLQTLGGWPLLQESWNSSTFDWLQLVADLRLYNNDVLLSEWVGPDIKNSYEYVIQIDQTNLGLPSRDYFLSPNNAAYLEAYKGYLVKVATLLGSTPTNAAQQAELIIDFEIKLAGITLSPEDRRNVSELYQRLTLQELQQAVPQVAWGRYLAVVLNGTISSNDTVVIFALQYVQDLVVLLENTEPEVIANYVLWRFVKNRVNNLDDRFHEAKQRFLYTLMGREEAPPRWKNCVTQVNSNMGMAVGAMFVQKYFDENSKNDTLVMTRQIQEAFRELLSMTSWIDQETKALAGEKVDAMTLRIGYPDFILNAEELNDKYKDLAVHPDTYFENTLNILKHMTKLEQEKVGQVVNKSVWSTAPAVVNAYYSRNRNQIMFPAGILQPPFYHRHFPKSLNFGGIGVVIGHEITHGFDDKGRLFDKHGNLYQWWQDGTIDTFHKRAQCLIDQYGKYKISEISMSLDGLNTQGENIADNGGVKQAYRAYQRWLLQHNLTEPNLPGISASHQQLFFLNFAQVWCGAMRPEAMRNKLKTAVHSPGRFRVLGTLTNSADFAQAYHCPAGSGMNPHHKCDVW